MITPFSRQQRITNTLLLNASFIDNLGLMHGKMGIAIYFFHLARKTENKIYEDYAGELIDEIYEEISTDTPCDFENGLAGIGWGIGYLVQHGFIEADVDDIFEDIETRLIHELIHHTPSEIGLLKGLSGIGAYFLMRMKQQDINSRDIKSGILRPHLIYLIEVMEKRLENGGIEKLLNGYSAEGLNNQTVKGSKEQAFSNNTETFDLTHDYSILLWFLAELHEQNILKFKVGKLIGRLIEPISDQGNWPKLQSNQLLLAFALSNLLPAIHNLETKETIASILKAALTTINREVIHSELPENNATMRYGTSGIAWIYHQLFRFAGAETYDHEAQFWLNRSNGNDIEGFMRSEFKVKANTFGLLEGMAGLTHYFN